MRLFAYHENAESVAALLGALSRQIEVRAFRVVSPLVALSARRQLVTGFHWDQVARSEHQSLVVVPGLRRFERLSSIALRRAYRTAVGRYGQPDFVLIDSPYLEPWTESVDVPLIYLAADAYRYYRWPTDRTVALERRIFARAHASLPVANLLADDFRAAGARGVSRVANGVDVGFADSAGAATPAPLDLAAVPRPRVAVVGTINSTYDWNLIEHLTQARPQVSFIFIGPIRESDARDRARIDQVFARPNVFSVGSKPHAELPSYLNVCDVLLNPLAVNDHSDRRFPLRLGEYLATDRPVLTTAIHEVRAFSPHVAIFRDAEEAVTTLDAAIAGEVTVDVAGRREWLRQNSWDARASEVVAALRAAADPA